MIDDRAGTPVMETTKDKIDKLTEMVRENGTIILDINKFLFCDDGKAKKDSLVLNSLDSAIAFLCDEVYMQREILYGIINRLGANKSDNVCAR